MFSPTTSLIGDVLPCQRAAPIRSCGTRVSMLQGVHSFRGGWGIIVTKQEGPGQATARWSPSSCPHDQLRMQNEAANEISRLEFVRLPIVTAARNASNSPVPKSMCHRIIELPTGADIHTRRSRPRGLLGAGRLSN